MAPTGWAEDRADVVNQDVGEMLFDPTQPSRRDVIVGENNFMLVALSSSWLGRGVEAAQCKARWHSAVAIL